MVGRRSAVRPYGPHRTVRAAAPYGPPHRTGRPYRSPPHGPAVPHGAFAVRLCGCGAVPAAAADRTTWGVRAAPYLTPYHRRSAPVGVRRAPLPPQPGRPLVRTAPYDPGTSRYARAVPAAPHRMAPHRTANRPAYGRGPHREPPHRTGSQRDRTPHRTAPPRTDPPHRTRPHHTATEVRPGTAPHGLFAAAPHDTTAPHPVAGAAPQHRSTARTLRDAGARPRHRMRHRTGRTARAHGTVGHRTVRRISAGQPGTACGGPCAPHRTHQPCGAAPTAAHAAATAAPQCAPQRSPQTAAPPRRNRNRADRNTANRRSARLRWAAIRNAGHRLRTATATAGGPVTPQPAATAKHGRAGTATAFRPQPATAPQTAADPAATPQPRAPQPACGPQTADLRHRRPTANRSPHRSAATRLTAKTPQPRTPHRRHRTIAVRSCGGWCAGLRCSRRAPADGGLCGDGRSPPARRNPTAGDAKE